MSWLFSAREPGLQVFDETLEKATSELNPVDSDEILLLGLQLSDLVRSKQLDALSAFKSIRKRLGHTNPNVKIATLHVLDVLVKNSGEAFLIIVASGREGWVTQLEDLCNSSNNDLRQLSLQSLQNWALAFQSQHTLMALSSSDIVGLYTRLRYSLQFPAISQAMTSSMITSMSAPEWIDSDICQRCRTSFTVTNRKHHCRNCGGVFDGDCSSKKMKLEHLGIEQEVRVCDGCQKKLTTPGVTKSAYKPPTSSSTDTSLSLAPPVPGAHRSSNSVSRAQRKAQEEADLERAIAASLAESYQASSTAPSVNYASSNGYGSSSLPGVGYGYDARQPSSGISTSSTSYPTIHRREEPSLTSALLPTKQMEEEDPDLAAAIRASLAEAPPASTASTSQLPYQHGGYHASAPYVPQAPTQASVPSYELAMSEFDALDSFSNALPSRQVSIDDANELFYRADRHRGKMIRSLEDSQVKAEMLDELNRKLQRAVRLYDSLLERRIASYNQPYQPYQAQASHAQAYQSQHPQYTQQPHQQQYQPQQYQPQQQQQQQQHYVPMPQQRHLQEYDSPREQYLPPLQALPTGISQASSMHEPAQTSQAMPHLQRQISLSHHQTATEPYAPDLQLQSSSTQTSGFGQHYQQPMLNNTQQHVLQYGGQSDVSGDSAYHQPHHSNAQHHTSQFVRQPYYGPLEQQSYASPPAQTAALLPMSSPGNNYKLPQELNYSSSPQKANGVSLPVQEAPAPLSFEPASLAATAILSSPRLEPAPAMNGHSHEPPQQVASSQYAQLQQPNLQPQRPNLQHDSSIADNGSLRDAAGNKLRLQGYYSANSFPAVPHVPVGGLPVVPSGPITNQDYDQPERYNDQHLQQKEVAALIEL